MLLVPYPFGMLPQPSLEYFVHTISNFSKVRICAKTLLRKSGLESHRVLGNLLVIVLVEVGNLCDAQTSFDKLKFPNDASWNTLITAYIGRDELLHALGLYQKLQNRVCLRLTAHNFVALLKACATIKDLERGLQIHGEAARLCMEKDVFVGSTLVDMYTKCGSLRKAHQVLNQLPTRNVVSWNALMAGYAKYGYGEQVLKCFDQMQHEGVSPDAVTFLCCLKACGISGAIEKGQELHVEIERLDLLSVDVAVGNTLVDMYVKCGSIAFAQQVFDKLPHRNVVTWTNLISGLAEHGDTKTATKCFEHMQGEGISPDLVAVVCGLKACGLKVIDDSDKEVVPDIEVDQAERGFFFQDFINESEGSCIFPKKAKQSSQEPLFCSTSTENAEYAELLRKDACQRMHSQETSSITTTFCYSREVRGGVEALREGKDLIIGNTLIDMYAKHGYLRKAQKIFDSLLNRDKVSWNVLIAGYAEHGHGREALKRFEQMTGDGFLPDIVTYVCALKACGTIGALEMGLRIHGDITKKGLLEADLVIGSTLVDMYAKSGALAMAHQVFNMLPVQNVVAWTSLISGYTRHGFGEEAIQLFDRMQVKGVFPDVAAVVSLLKACIDTGATGKGKEIHVELERKGFLERDLAVGNALVDMYAKCGSLFMAQSLFDSLPLHDVVSWNSLIAGYVGHGRGEEALQWLEQMQLEGVAPDAVTYSSSLQACSKIGVIDQSKEIVTAFNKTGFLKGDAYVGSTLVNMSTRFSNWRFSYGESFDFSMC